MHAIAAAILPTMLIVALGYGWARIGASALFGFSGPQRAALVLQSAMPMAAINYLFADLYATEPEDIASLAAISTLLSVVTTPLLLATVLR